MNTDSATTVTATARFNLLSFASALTSTSIARSAISPERKIGWRRSDRQ